MPTTSSIYSTPYHQHVLTGTAPDGTPAGYDRRARIEAAWAVGHDLAAEKYGDDRVPDWFGPDGGPPLMRQLQEAPDDTTAEALLGLVKAHLGIEDAPAQPEAPATGGHE